MRELKINRRAAFGLVLLGSLAIAAMAFADPPVHTKTFVRQLDATTSPFFGPTIEGSSAKMQRSEDSVWIKINTTQLPAGAYTVWAAIFNNPSACQFGTDGFLCGTEDLPPPGQSNPGGTDGSVIWVTGGVVDETGVGQFRAHIEEGMPQGQVLRGTGLNDAEGAEIHFVVRYHGPISDDPTIAELQVTTVTGGCGAPPLFACYEPQAGRFPLQ